jgi:hypothetical protein
MDEVIIVTLHDVSAGRPVGAVRDALVDLLHMIYPEEYEVELLTPEEGLRHVQK